MVILLESGKIESIGQQSHRELLAAVDFSESKSLDENEKLAKKKREKKWKLKLRRKPCERRSIKCRISIAFVLDGAEWGLDGSRDDYGPEFSIFKQPTSITFMFHKQFSISAIDLLQSTHRSPNRGLFSHIEMCCCKRYNIWAFCFFFQTNKWQRWRLYFVKSICTNDSWF